MKQLTQSNLVYIFATLIISLLFIKCGNDDFDIMIPNDEQFDVNLDGGDDIQIFYVKTDIDKLPRNIDPDTLTYDKSVLCIIAGSNKNQILIDRPDPLYWGLPKLKVGDTIDIKNSGSLFWEHSRSGNLLTKKRYNSSSEWEEDWKVLAQVPTYIGVKITSDSGDELCWVKLNLNTITGEVEVERHKCTQSSLIIINE